MALINYLERITLLESGDESLRLLSLLEQKVDSQFEAILQKIVQSKAIVDEFPAVFNELIQGSVANVDPILLSAELATYEKNFDSFRTLSLEQSQQALQTLRSHIANISAINLECIFFLDHENVQVTLTNITRFHSEIEVLSTKSLVGLENTLMNGFVEHARAHLSILLDQSRDEALQLLEHISSGGNSLDGLKQLADAVESINAQIDIDAKNTLLEMDRLAGTPSFLALIEDAERTEFLRLKPRIDSQLTENQLANLKASAVLCIRNAIKCRFTSISNSAGLRQLLVGDAGGIEFQVDGPESFDQLSRSFESAIALIDPIAQGVGSLIAQSKLDINGLLQTNLFIGQKAFEFKRELEDLILAIDRSPAFFSSLTQVDDMASQRVDQLLKNLSSISEISSTLVRNATAIPKRTALLSEIQIGYDIPNVTELTDGTPSGLRSRAYGGDQTWLFCVMAAYRSPQPGSLDSGRCVCVSFPVGIVPIAEFRIDLTPETIFGDWIRWLAGGFLFRPKPANGIHIPKLPDRLADFMRVHVFSQWSGKAGLDDIVAGANRAVGPTRNDCEAFFSNVTTS
jgi:hypothetical protein